MRRGRRPTAASREAPEKEQPLSPPTEPAVPHAGNGRGAAEHHFVSPVVARIAAEHGIDPAQIEGTGRGGRVTKKDILAYVESGAPPRPRRPPLPPRHRRHRRRRRAGAVRTARSLRPRRTGVGAGRARAPARASRSSR